MSENYRKTAATAREWADERPLDPINASLSQQIAATVEALTSAQTPDFHDLSDLHYLGCFLCRRMEKDICEEVSVGDAHCPLHLAPEVLQAA